MLFVLCDKGRISRVYNDKVFIKKIKKYYYSYHFTHITIFLSSNKSIFINIGYGYVVLYKGPNN